MPNLDSFTQQVTSLLGSSKKVVITNHVNPDGDAVGSALALAALLKTQDLEVKVVMPNNYPQNLKWMVGTDAVLTLEGNEAQATVAIKEADLIFHLDYNSLKRSGPLEELLTQSQAAKVMIDHHQQPDDFAEAIYSDTSMSSTCEMVYHFLSAMGWQKAVTKATAEAIYTGIATDTGNFRFASTTAATHKAAAFLIDKGVNPGLIASRVYDSNSPNRLKLLSRALDNMQVLEKLGAVIISLDTTDFDQIGYEKGITEGFVNYGLSLLGIEVSVFIYQSDKGVKMSFRSKTNFDVNTFARTYFNGGGHKNAAGALSPYSLQETREKLMEYLTKHQNEIVAS
jgi:phosphoesterase RecJ-like protein